MKALLVIAGKVQRDGKLVTREDAGKARNEGATDVEMYDTVLIAAPFCMFNHNVDGLKSCQPRDATMYALVGQLLAERGYLKPSR